MVPRPRAAYRGVMAEANAHWHEVLVVEDEGDIRDAISHLLDFQAFVTRSANDGGHALAQLRDGYRPCIILLDLTMPGMDGPAFCREQQALDGCRDIPVVVVSGRDDAKEISHAVGAADFLQKPVRVTTLLDAVDRHCRQSRRDA